MRHTALTLIALTCLAACSDSMQLPTMPRPAFLFGDRADPDLAADLAKMTYPKDAKVAEDLDIVLTKAGPALHVANRTPRIYRNVHLWLNQQYVAVLDELPIGADTTLSMNRFINSFGEPFPVGGLLNPDINYPVVLAELYQPPTPTAAPPNDATLDPPAPAVGQRHRLIVRDGNR